MVGETLEVQALYQQLRNQQQVIEQLQGEILELHRSRAILQRQNDALRERLAKLLAEDGHHEGA